MIYGKDLAGYVLVMNTNSAHSPLAQTILECPSDTETPSYTDHKQLNFFSSVSTILFFFRNPIINPMVTRSLQGLKQSRDVGLFLLL